MMTTSIRVHVNGCYRATVVQKTEAYGETTTVVEGNYEGSPNPSGEAHFYLPHPATATFDITEEQVPE